MGIPELAAPVEGEGVDQLADWASLWADLLHVDMTLHARADIPGDAAHLFTRRALWEAAVIAYGRTATTGRRKQRVTDLVSALGPDPRNAIKTLWLFFSNFGLSGAPDEAKLKNLKGKDELVQALKDSYAFAQKGIDTITPQNAFVVTGTGPMNMKMTRAGGATFCLAHSMDHYGQMVEYLRMNGIVPPASQKQPKSGGSD